MKLPYKVMVERKKILSQYILLMKTMWYFARGGGHRSVYVMYVMFFFANLGFAAKPYLIGQVVNALQLGGDDLLASSMKWLVIYVCASIFFWLFHGPARIIERRLAFKVKKNYCLYCYDVVTKMPLRWHRDHHTGNTMNRVNRSVDGLYMFSDNQYVYFEAFIRFVMIFIMLAYFNVYVSLGVFLFTVLIFRVLRYFDLIVLEKSHEKNEKEHVFSSSLFDYVSNIDNVILFGLVKHSHQKISTALSALYVPLKTMITVNEIKWFCLMMFMALGHFGALLGYIYFHTSQGIEIKLGDLVAVFQYMLQLDWILFSVAGLYKALIRQGTDLGAVEELMNDCEKYGVDDNAQNKLKLDKGAISFKNVDFSYNKKTQVFKGLSLEIPSRQKLGIVGVSGAGKTSLVHLLLRFYEASGQDITIDGQNITDITPDSLRQNIAIIPQDTSLFETSILENIRVGRLDATDEEVKDAAKRAYCDEFILEMPDDYDTYVGERGVKLSGGQRQRVAIARAILKDSPILILDEATSALDSLSERYIQKSLKELMKKKTVIAIAHRLSTLTHLDRIIVLDKGKIIEDGTHMELLKRKGQYAMQWDMQSDGFM